MLSDGSIVTQTTPTDELAGHRGVEDRVGSVGRLLPAVAVQVRRRRPRRPGAPRPELGAADPQGHEQPPGVLPRRRRHRLRQAQQPVDRHGRRLAGRRRRRRRLRDLQRPADRRGADGARHERDRRHVHADLQRPDDGSARVQLDRCADRRGAARRSATSASTTSRPPAGPVNTANVTVTFRRALAADRPAADDRRRDRPDRRDDADRHAQHDGDRRPVPAADRRRPPLDAEHERPARQDPADQGQGRRHRAGRRQQGRLRQRRRVHDPGREPVPARRRRAAGQDASPRSTRWASGTRSGSRSTRTTSPT